MITKCAKYASGFDKSLAENADSCLDKGETFLWSAHHTPDTMPRASTT